MTEDQIRFYVEARVEVDPRERIESRVVTSDTGRHFIEARTSGAQERFPHLERKHVQIELQPDGLDPRACHEAARRLAGHWVPPRNRKPARPLW